MFTSSSEVLMANQSSVPPVNLLGLLTWSMGKRNMSEPKAATLESTQYGLQSHHCHTDGVGVLSLGLPSLDCGTFRDPGTTCN